MRFFGLKIHPHHLPSPIKKLGLTFGKTATSGWGLAYQMRIWEESKNRIISSEIIVKKGKINVIFGGEVFFLSNITCELSVVI